MGRDAATGGVLASDAMAPCRSGVTWQARRRVLLGTDVEVGGVSQGGRMHGLTKLAALLVGLVLLGHMRPALAASSLRCSSRLVGEGQTIAEVYDRCGEPTERTVSTEFVTVRVSCDVTVTRAVPVEYWTYNLGPKQFVRYLTFRDGTLIAIDEGSYGNW